jgi:hypothetical protein
VSNGTVALVVRVPCAGPRNIPRRPGSCSSGSRPSSFGVKIDDYGSRVRNFLTATPYVRCVRRARPGGVVAHVEPDAEVRRNGVRPTNRIHYHFLPAPQRRHRWSGASLDQGPDGRVQARGPRHLLRRVVLCLGIWAVRLLRHGLTANSASDDMTELNACSAKKRLWLS